MKEKLSAFFENVRVGMPSCYANLAVYPITIDENKEFSYLLLGEALKKNQVSIGEGGEGSVPELFVDNKSDKRIFIMDGEELIGAKQNRILNISIVIEVKTKTKVPVSCVERGRWHWDNGEGMKPGEIAFSCLRMENIEHVSENLKHHKVYNSNQSAVWDSVANKIHAFKVSSMTESMHDIFQVETNSIDDYRKKIALPDGASGIAVAFNNRLFCIDIFNSAETLKKLWNKLLASYILDAIEVRNSKPNAPPVTQDDVFSFLMSAKEAGFDTYDSVGIGKDVRFKGKDCMGSALVCDDALIHLTMFKTNVKIGVKL